MGRAGKLVDRDSPSASLVRFADGSELQLVMSDEFSSDGRRFDSGADPLFEAVEKPDHTNEAIQFYKSSERFVTTKDGNLVLTTRAEKTSWQEYDEKGFIHTRTKNYTSGMIQTWNKFCFTGGILEMSIELPGQSESGGLWPAAWLMGNLARATFEKTTTGVWPWSYDTCGAVPDLPTKQEINACEKDPGFGMHPHQGRGAPEIDIFEVMPGHEMPGLDKPVRAFMSSSLQISPGVPLGPRRPKNGKKLNASYDWYENINVGEGGAFNEWFWGQECGPEIDHSANRIHKYMQDAISVNTFLSETHFDSHHVYRLEWQPGPYGYLHWYLDGKLLLGIEGSSLQSLTGSIIPQEPMYLILNTAISHRWGMPEPCPISSCPQCWRCYDCTNPECQCTLPEGMKNCKNLPASMRIDYIRLYQDKDDESHTIGCSPPQYPTKEFIERHQDRYRNWKPIGEEIESRELSFYTILIAFVVFIGIVKMFYWRSTLQQLVRFGHSYRRIPEHGRPLPDADDIQMI